MWNARRRRRKQRLAAPARYYGGGGTWQDSDVLDVETRNGVVVAVWFRCQILPFRQAEIDADRAVAMQACPATVRMTGVEVLDPAP